MSSQLGCEIPEAENRRRKNENGQPPTQNMMNKNCPPLALAQRGWHVYYMCLMIRCRKWMREIDSPLGGEWWMCNRGLSVIICTTQTIVWEATFGIKYPWSWYAADQWKYSPHPLLKSENKLNLHLRPTNLAKRKDVQDKLTLFSLSWTWYQVNADQIYQNNLHAIFLFCFLIKCWKTLFRNIPWMGWNLCLPYHRQR